MEIHETDGYIERLFVAGYPDGRILVLDGGCRCDVGRIARLCRKAGKSLRDVTLQFCSHMHPDHAGGTTVLKRTFGIPVAAQKNVNAWYAGPGGFLQHKIDTTLGYMVSRKTKRPIRSLFYPRKIPVDFPMKDGDSLPGFPDWEVIETAGHTAHDVVLYNKDAKTLYAADVMLIVGNDFSLPFPVPMPEKMKESLKRIRDLDVNTLLLAHGGRMEVDGLEEIVDGLVALLDSDWMNAFLKRIAPFTYFARETKSRW